MKHKDNPPPLSNYVFVTVGSTSFDDLISAVHVPHVHHLLKTQGYTHIIYQIGTGDDSIFLHRNEPTDDSDTLTVEYFRSKNSIAPYIQNAALVICHAGVGTVMETLRMKKQVVVVVNPSLMDNHQLEVAAALEADKHVYLCRAPNVLEKVLANISKTAQLIPIEELNTALFPALLESEFLLAAPPPRDSALQYYLIAVCILVLSLCFKYGWPATSIK